MSFISKKSKIELLLDIYKDPDRKSIYKILIELLSLTLYHGVIPTHYFAYFLFKKNTTNIKDYYPSKYLDANIKLFFNDYSVSEVLENKLFFDLFYSQFNISLPQILMYNHKNVFIIDNKRYEVKNIMDYKDLLKKIFNNNPLIESIIIKKNI